MNISKRAKLMVAAAGIVAAAGTTGAAFTGAGLVNAAGTSAWVGGTVSQSYTGASLQSISYDWVDNSQTEIEGVHLTFAESVAAHTVQVAFNGSSTKINCANDSGDTTGAVYSCNSTTDPNFADVTLSSISVTVS